MQPHPIHISYRIVPPVECDGYVFGVEDVRNFVDDLLPLARALADETSAVLRWHALSAPGLLEQQSRGYYTFTVRHAGALVGFCFARRTREGATDAGMYLKPEHRRGWTAVRLAQYVQDGMRALGAQYMTWETDEASGSHLLAEYLNHQLISRRYVVKFQGASE